MRRTSCVQPRCFVCSASIGARDLRAALEQAACLPDQLGLRVAVSCPGCAGRVMAVWHRPLEEVVRRAA